MSRLEILQAEAKRGNPIAIALLERKKPVIKESLTTENEQIISDSAVTFDEFWEAANRIEGIEK